MSMRGSARLSAYALLVVSGVLLASVYAFGKVAVAALRGELPQLSLANVRYAGVAGAIGVTAPNLVVFSAVSHLPAGVIGAVMALSPVLTYGIAAALKVERLRLRSVVGLVLGFVGAAGMAGLSTDAIGGATFTCVLAALAAPLLLASANVFRSRAWPPGLTPLGAAALMLCIQAFVLTPVAIGFGQFPAPSPDDAGSRIALAGAALFAAVFYLGAFELQKRGGPVMVGQLGQVIALASLVIGATLFHEVYSPATFFAVSLVLLGAVLVTGAGPAARRSASTLSVSPVRAVTCTASPSLIGGMPRESSARQSSPPICTSPDGSIRSTATPSAPSIG